MAAPSTRLLLACTLLGLIGAPRMAAAKPLDTISITASSTYPEQGGVSYEAKNLADSKKAMAWFEGASGSGLDSTVTMDLGGSRIVTGFRILNGYWLSSDMWQRNNRVKNLDVELSDGTRHSFELSNEMVAQDIRFPTAVTTSSLLFRIKGVHQGTTFNDTAISELRVFDDTPPAAVEATRQTASSFYPEDADGDYGPDNLVDGIVDSMWCEGDKAGDGTGQWIELGFDGSESVSKLEISNGNAAGFSSFMNANSATAATLTFSDGSTEAIALKNSFMKQTIAFSPRRTSSVRLTFTEVRKGKEFNDLCVSELAILP